MSSFDDITKEVGRLQKVHDDLVKAIPKLSETKKGIQEDLTELNKDKVKSSKELEELNDQITLNTHAYNEWQAKELLELNKQKLDLKTRIDKFELESAEQSSKIRAGLEMIASTKLELENDRKKITKDRRDIEAQQGINNKWAETLRGMEAKYKADEELNQKTLKEIAEQVKQHHIREESISGAEEQAKSIIAEAEKNRRISKEILANAKEDIANNDARSQALDIRERLLKDRERKVKVREIAITDKENVLIGRGN